MCIHYFGPLCIYGISSLRVNITQKTCHIPSFLRMSELMYQINMLCEWKHNVASYVNCNRRYQTCATARRMVTILVEATEPLQTKGFPEVECTTALQPAHPHFCYSTLVVIMPHCWCVNLLHICRSMLALYAKCSWGGSPPPAHWSGLYPVFKKITILSTLNPTKGLHIN